MEFNANNLSEAEQKMIVQNGLNQALCIIEELRYVANLVRQMLNSIHEKNSNVEKSMDLQYAHQDKLFEPLDSEMSRKVADIVLVTKACNLLEAYKFNCQLNFPGDLAIQDRAVAVGRKYVSGGLSLTEIVDLLPEVSTVHYETILRYRRSKELLISLRAKLPDEEAQYQPPEVEWTKRIEEMVTMSAYMVQHGYSRNWRSSLMAKLDEYRPIVECGKPHAELEEALKYLVQNYYRLRKAYDMMRKKLERSDSFLKEELERCG